MKRCSVCVIPATAKGIQLNDQGVCQLCQGYQPFQPKGRDELMNLIGEYKKDNTNPEHDCVVPISGGRDSSYVLYYTAKELGLRPVALHNDNDFETPIVKDNLERVSQALGVPLVRIQSRANLGKKIVAEKLKMNAPFGPGLVAAQTCEACKYGFESASYNYARNNGIGMVVWGDSSYESTSPYYDLVEGAKAPPSKWRRLLSPGALSLFKYKIYFNKMKEEYGPDTPHNLHEIHMFDYITWDQDILVNTISALGWKAPEDSPTSWRVDCKLVPVVDFLTKTAYGVSKIELGFSNMIRNGKMDRADAIRKLEQIENNTDPEQIKKTLAEDLTIPASVIKSLIP